MTTTPVRFGLLFPTANADARDFSSLLSRAAPGATLGVVELSWPTGTHSELGSMSDDELAVTVAQLGDPSVIAEALSGSAGQYEAVALAVTSASFLRSANEHRRQLEAIETTAQSAETSTLRGFQDAITHLGVISVSVASVYPPHFTDSFIDHVSRPRVDVVHRVDANARTDRDPAQWGDAKIIDLVAKAAHPRAQAVLLPETALHTDHLTSSLEDVAGVPVLTATQVTVWSLYRSVDTMPSATGAGLLFIG
ncbi:hypothetical protein MHN80_12630 [Gordonia McavH-238-E]|uniref:aspartate racemase/maleate isomerase family protein n=1 Tax=Gordonia sp. McavH-238-E TaxID=2917736 RepID=UPI001EF60520|nr:hypothetical protein [Gordonia sp. McavH-238-E]MCG7633158.1 hypothetical protein [Gordonia sp. McavH-238-E]